MTLSMSYLPGEEVSAETRHGDPGPPVEDPGQGDQHQEDPPEPEHEEVLLVEEVVAEDAEEVGPVHGPGQRAHVDVAGHLGGEQLAHGVVHHMRPPVVGHILHHLNKHKKEHEIFFHLTVSNIFYYFKMFSIEQIFFIDKIFFSV